MKREKRETKGKEKKSRLRGSRHDVKRQRKIKMEEGGITSSK